MENEKKKKDWKDLLLRSGLPLEHDVADLLEKHKIIPTENILIQELMRMVSN